MERREFEEIKFKYPQFSFLFGQDLFEKEAKMDELTSKY